MKRVLTLEKLIIDGGFTLNGGVKLQGAKNSALPILAAAILCDDECCIDNCPHLSDCDASMNIIRYLGRNVRWEDNCVIIKEGRISRYDIPEKLMREMRSSIIFLGALLAKTGRASVSLPGGCELGPRPIDLHISSLKQMGVVITENHGLIECAVHGKLKGTMISLPFPSVGATENIILAAVTAEGTTVITNAAREPEITDLANFLINCGAKIHGAGESTIIIKGVERLVGAYHRIIPDRIETATYMAAVAVSGGSAELYGAVPEHLRVITTVFDEMGCNVKACDGIISIIAPEHLGAVKYIRTMPYPGFPTDAQAIIMAVTALCRGTSVFVETVFSGRYRHVDELRRMGASIKIEDRVAVVEGVERLSGANVNATDLRGGAALVVAALAAEGKTKISSIHHIDRGYEDIESKLSSLGARIKRV